MKNGKELYRNSERGRIAGVCAGIADYFGLEVWLVRILTVTGFFLLGGPFFFVAYIACWFILEKKPSGHHQSQETVLDQGSGKGWRNRSADTLDDDEKIEVKTKVWKAGEPPRQAYNDIVNRFARNEERLRKIETYVTSREFQLNQEISRL